MQIALFQGISPVSRAIRFFTRSKYSHAAFRFDAHAAQVASRISGECPFSKMFFIGEGCVIEAWQGGVKNSPSLSSLHEPRTPVDLFNLIIPLTDDQEAKLLRTLDSQIGEPYSYWNIIRFLTRQKGDEDGSWFCSELVFQDLQDCGLVLLQNCEAWEVPPRWLALPTLAKFEKTIYTN